MAHPQLTRKTIVGITAKTFGLPIEEVLSTMKNRRFVECRNAAALLMREFLPGASLPQVATAIGMTDHTSAIHAISKAVEWGKSVPAFAAKMEATRQAVREWVPQAPRFVAERDLQVLAPVAAREVKPPARGVLRAISSVPSRLNGRRQHFAQFSEGWWEDNDKRFRKATASAHPERFRAVVLEAAE